MVRGYPNGLLGRRNNVGFTLIELLVVLAVITLLLAILLPALSQARRRTRRLACQSNLKQIAFAWNMYLDDHDGAFFQKRSNAQFTFGGWKGIHFPDEERPLNKYLSLPEIPEFETEAKIFECPADNGVVSLRLYRYDGTSYSTNILLVGQDKIGWLPSTELMNEINERLKRLNRRRVASPARLLLTGDSPWADQWLPSPYPRGSVWHDKCCHYNLAFLDSHVDFLKIRKGLYTDEYTVIPFKELYQLAKSVQVEEPCLRCD
jgi:prepilin-type N-terminal cleavage/methylation domain-containing protein